MDNNYFGKGIPLASGFDYGAKAPLDSRIRVKTIVERDAHVTNNRAYEGMRVFVIDEGKEYRYNGSEWEFIPSESDVQLMIAEAQFNGSDIDLSNLATKDDLPTKVSDLENDLNYIIKEEGKSLLADTEIERLLTLQNYDDTDLRNELSNKVDLNYIQDNFASKSYEHEHENLVDLNSITSERIESWDNKSDFDGNYNSLINAPSKVSDFENDLSFATEAFVQNKIAEAQLNQGEVDLSGLATKDELNTKMDKFDLSIYATQEFVEGRISNHDHTIISDNEVDSFVDDLFL